MGTKLRTHTIEQMRNGKLFIFLHIKFKLIKKLMYQVWEIKFIGFRNIVQISTKRVKINILFV